MEDFTSAPCRKKWDVDPDAVERTTADACKEPLLVSGSTERFPLGMPRLMPKDGPFWTNIGNVAEALE